MASGINKAIFDFCMKHTDDPKHRSEGIPPRDPADYEWLKKALAEIKSDAERMENCLGIVKEEADKETKLVAMEEILYFVEDLDNANDFCKKLKGAKVMLNLLNPNEDTTVRSGAADIIGTLAQNNIICQGILLADGAIPTIIKQLEVESGSRTKLIYALSSITRGNRDILQFFIKNEEWVAAVVDVLKFHKTDLRACKKVLFYLACLWRDDPEVQKPKIPSHPETLSYVKALLENDGEDVQELAVDWCIQLAKHGARADMEKAGINPAIVSSTAERARFEQALAQ
eukprot:TRINITY_DN534_c7_g1_i1.p1 TRINITY_DN534_c7_g1~~TRINITY_DN534_c7_g1_i1.p1  ORF type:complete len:307 (+),score=60.33 TRINITY_DN534_c7_g1_i1:65-922(+)